MLILIKQLQVLSYTLYCQSGFFGANYLHVFDIISFLFAVAAKQINHHTTQQISLFFPPLLALCLLHIINHSSFFSCPLIDLSSQLYVTKPLCSQMQ